MGRRGIHNEGSRILLDGCRQGRDRHGDGASPFTLICVLHFEG